MSTSPRPTEYPWALGAAFYPYARLELPGTIEPVHKQDWKTAREETAS